ncbi:hypothetical protein [Vampirovibrio sp.]|uniref:hypothetical protein n=1 Tax=Vampirovibrio sp. TaxID=2717857 RepID=UPI003592FA4A
MSNKLKILDIQAYFKLLSQQLSTYLLLAVLLVGLILSGSGFDVSGPQSQWPEESGMIALDLTQSEACPYPENQPVLKTDTITDPQIRYKRPRLLHFASATVKPNPQYAQARKIRDPPSFSLCL